MRYLAIIAAFYFTIYAAAIMAQRSLLYFPDERRPPPEHSDVADIQIVDITAEDGLALQSWYRPPSKEGLPTVLYYHGNGGNHGWRSDIVLPFAKAGYGVLLASYRGYGGNQGKPSEDGLYMDARAQMEWLITAGETPLDRIVIYGESLGSGPAIQMASEYEVGALILQTPFDSVPNVAALHFFYFPFVSYFVWDRFDNASKIGALKMPTLILIAENDKVIPARSSAGLVAAATPPVKTVTLKNAGHHSVHSNGAPAEFLEFLEGYGANR